MVKLKRFVLVILFIFVSLSLFAFKIESTAKPIAEIFYQFDDKENLPKIKSDSYDRFIEILVYKLDINDLIGASYLSDLKLTKSNLIGEYKYEANPDSRIKLSEIPTVPEFGLLYFEINSDRMSEKFFLNIKKTEAVVMLSEEGIKLRLWNILDGRIIDKVKCIRLEDGVNIG
ncbi:MAG: alpha-2-macroglobulin, partial [Kosmotogales bacterium]|nr:alpha-2-macroglobulin [Kosmotogales bacterium]